MGHKKKPAHRGHGGGLRNADRSGGLIGTEGIKRPNPLQAPRLYVIGAGSLVQMFADVAAVRQFAEVAR